MLSCVDAVFDQYVKMIDILIGVRMGEKNEEYTSGV